MYHSRIFHITPENSIEQLFRTGVYTTPTLESEKFIHCSTKEQVLHPAKALFSGRTDLRLLEIDTDPEILKSKLVYEDCYEEGMLFPHVYGPISIDAIRRIHPFPWCEESGFNTPETSEDFRDSKVLALFDLDSTLIRGTHNHRAAFERAFESCTGQPLGLEGIPVHGQTDRNLIKKILQSAGISQSEDLLEKLERELISQYFRIESEQPDTVQEIEGASEVIQYLKGRGIPICAVTGNMENIGWNKLKKASLDQFFCFGAFSSHSGERSELVAYALREFPDLSHCFLVGDATQDMKAARANNILALGVTTGNANSKELTDAGADAVFSNLSEVQNYLNQILP